MLDKCVFPGCASHATEASRYCLTHDQTGWMQLAAALEETMDRPAPVMPPQRIWDEIVKRLEGEKAT